MHDFFASIHLEKIVQTVTVWVLLCIQVFRKVLCYFRFENDGIHGYIRIDIVVGLNDVKMVAC